MSAIAGIVWLGGRKADPDVVAAMMARMASRTPEGAALWADGPAAFGFSAFRVVPEDRFAQPPFDDGRQVLVADARIDNRDALIETLGLSPSDGYSDPGVLFEAFKAWRSRTAERLRGDFAFAGWDRAERTLTLARDTFGIRSLYYAHLPGLLFAFASEIKALVGTPHVSEAINEVRLGTYIADFHDESHDTVYRDILRVPRAHTLVVTPGALHVTETHPVRPDTGMEGWSTEKYVDGFRERFEAAVRARVRSSEPVGSHLSGGLDSSAVSVVARDVLRESGQTLRTFSLTYDEAAGADESPYIQAVVDQGGVEPLYIAGDATGPLSNLDALYDILDEGVVGGNQHTLWAMMERARELGVTVMLDGLDGDTTVGHGYRFLDELARAGDWDRFGAEARALVARFGTPDHSHSFEAVAVSLNQVFMTHGVPVLREHARRWRLVRLARDLRGTKRALGTDPARMARALRRELLPSRRTREESGISEQVSELTALLKPGFAERVGLYGRMLAEEDEVVWRGERDTQRAMFQNERIELGLSGLNQIGARFGIEPRHPFMDLDLIQYCLALPPSMSLHEGWTRYVLREALRGPLPPLIADRIGKADLSGNTGTTLFGKDGDTLRAALENLGLLEAYVRRSAVDDLVRRARTDDAGQHSTARVLLMRIATLSVWMNKQLGAGG